MLDHHPNLGEQIIYIYIHCVYIQYIYILYIMYISLCGQRPYPQYGGSGGVGDHIAHMYVLYIYIYIYIYEE